MESFAEIGIDKRIIKAISELGYETPTPIQAQAIPHCLNSDQDLIASAQTGTGKTAAFGLPLIHHIDVKDYAVQGIVLAPTRELCIQISKDLESFAKYVKGLSILAVYGGSSIETQIRALRRGVHIVVATPGRCVDLIKRRKLDLQDVQRVVLDEADEMLNMGFKEDLNAILGETPEEKQTLLFSATMSKDIMRITKNYMDNPAEIKVARMNKAADNVEHVFYQVKSRDRYNLLKRVVDMSPEIYGIIFCRTRRETNEVAAKLGQDGYNSDVLNGDLSQNQRDHVMNKFRKGKVQLLVATDVAARGLDVNELTHVINYNLPDDPEVYVHRSGRTGRAGRSGVSVAIIHTREGHKVKGIERHSGIRFVKADPPSPKEIVKAQLFKLVNNIKSNTVSDKDIAAYLPEIMEELEEMSKEDIVKSMISVEFSRFLKYYKNASELSVSDDRGGRDRNDRRGRDRDDRRGRRDRDDRRGRDRGRDRDRDRGRNSRSRDRDERFEERSERKEKPRRERASSEASDKSKLRLFINVGTKNNLDQGRLEEMIGETLNTTKKEASEVAIFKKFSFFEMEKGAAKKLIKNLHGTQFENVELQVEVSEEKPASAYPPPKRKKKSSYGRKDGKRKDFGNFSKKKKKGKRNKDKGRPGGKKRRARS